MELLSSAISFLPLIVPLAILIGLIYATLRKLEARSDWKHYYEPLVERKIREYHENREL